MAGKPIGIRIPDYKTYDLFMEHVKRKHGKIHGVAGLELQKAMEQYLKNPETVDIKAIKQEISKELQKANDTIPNLKKKHGNEVKKLKQKITVAEALNKQTERIKERNHDLEKDIEALKREKEYFQGLQEKNDKLRNKHDHLQERFNKSQRELNVLERENSQLRVVVAKVEKMSLWERLLNRLPSEVKELESFKE